MGPFPPSSKTRGSGPLCGLWWREQVCLYSGVPRKNTMWRGGRRRSNSRLQRGEHEKEKSKMDIVVSNLGWFSWIIFGALAGWLASILTGRNSQQGCLMNIIVGIVGAFLGGWGYTLITGHPLTVGWNLTAFIVSVIGAVVLLALINLVFGRRSK